jgi:hypothetical protein
MAGLGDAVERFGQCYHLTRLLQQRLRLTDAMTPVSPTALPAEILATLLLQLQQQATAWAEIVALLQGNLGDLQQCRSSTDVAGSPPRVELRERLQGTLRLGAAVSARFDQLRVTAVGLGLQDLALSPLTAMEAELGRATTPSTSGGSGRGVEVGAWLSLAVATTALVLACRLWKGGASGALPENALAWSGGSLAVALWALLRSRTAIEGDPAPTSGRVEDMAQRAADGATLAVWLRSLHSLYRGSMLSLRRVERALLAHRVGACSFFTRQLLFHRIRRAAAGLATANARLCAIAAT